MKIVKSLGEIRRGCDARKKCVNKWSVFDHEQRNASWSNINNSLIDLAAPSITG